MGHAVLTNKKKKGELLKMMKGKKLNSRNPTSRH